jgi:hypothetical protein
MILRPHAGVVIMPDMTDHHKSRGGPLYWLGHRSRRFWIFAVVLMPVLYVGSFGPACWIATQGESDSLGRTVVLYSYYPLLWIASRLPERVNRAVNSYARCLASDGSSPGLLGDAVPTWYYVPPPNLLGR